MLAENDKETKKETNMSIIGWSKKFQPYEKMDVSLRTRATEKMFWFSILIAVVLTVIGILLMVTNFHYDIIGFLLMLAGIAMIFLSIIGAFIRLAVYEVVSEIRLQNKPDKFGE